MTWQVGNDVTSLDDGVHRVENFVSLLGLVGGLVAVRCLDDIVDLLEDVALAVAVEGRRHLVKLLLADVGEDLAGGARVSGAGDVLLLVVDDGLDGGDLVADSVGDLVGLLLAGVDDHLEGGARVSVRGKVSSELQGTGDVMFLSDLGYDVALADGMSVGEGVSDLLGSQDVAHLLTEGGLLLVTFVKLLLCRQYLADLLTEGGLLLVLLLEILHLVSEGGLLGWQAVNDSFDLLCRDNLLDDAALAVAVEGGRHLVKLLLADVGEDLAGGARVSVLGEGGGRVQGAGDVLLLVVDDGLDGGHLVVDSVGDLVGLLLAGVDDHLEGGARVSVRGEGGGRVQGAGDVLLLVVDDGLDGGHLVVDSVGDLVGLLLAGVDDHLEGGARVSVRGEVASELQGAGDVLLLSGLGGGGLQQYR
ncbi:hypothetical protein ONE63_005498 [Megalurothrips usitatus]|uniref:NAD-specific glutamate dehydrogenase n=1 Tax=Megalurothrips usitatus TaxID=439358 RepID=A0AAV7XVP4_9NEOP|nr:hypothetical protein ONE63_005498 [Megalurothrips usitatus]